VRVRIAAVTATVSPVIAQQPAHEGKPGITYRQAGERAVLVEYGEMVFDLALNFLVLAAKDALDEQPPTA
jgi:urea carboxylase